MTKWKIRLMLKDADHVLRHCNVGSSAERLGYAARELLAHAMQLEATVRRKSAALGVFAKKENWAPNRTGDLVVWAGPVNAIDFAVRERDARGVDE